MNGVRAVAGQHLNPQKISAAELGIAALLRVAVKVRGGLLEGRTVDAQPLRETGERVGARQPFGRRRARRPPGKRVAFLKPPVEDHKAGQVGKVVARLIERLDPSHPLLEGGFVEEPLPRPVDHDGVRVAELGKTGHPKPRRLIRLLGGDVIAEEEEEIFRHPVDGGADLGRHHHAVAGDRCGEHRAPAGDALEPLDQRRVALVTAGRQDDAAACLDFRRAACPHAANTGHPARARNQGRNLELRQDRHLREPQPGQKLPDDRLTGAQPAALHPLPQQVGIPVMHVAEPTPRDHIGA